MIKSITFKKPTSTGLGSYIAMLPALSGKTIDFMPGLNIVVGPNGCGKTSLLKTIRAITCCDGTFSSNLSKGHGEWMMHRRNVYDAGYFDFADLKADYMYSVFNLRKGEEMESYEWSSSSTNFSQFFGQRRKSDGQNVKTALNMLVAFILFGEDKTSEMDEKNGREGRSFIRSVLDPLHKTAKNIPDSIWTKMEGYYFANMIDTLKDDQYKPFHGLSILMDEPDKGLDIVNVEDVYSFLCKLNNATGSEGDGRLRYQAIVVLHNVGLIHKLKKLDGVHFVELEEGYVNKVEDFFTT